MCLFLRCYKTINTIVDYTYKTSGTPPLTLNNCQVAIAERVGRYILPEGTKQCFKEFPVADSCFHKTRQYLISSAGFEHEKLKFPLQIVAASVNT